MQANDLWIQTYSGRRFHFLTCTDHDVALVDIAVPLSRIPRFNGHTSRTYSVAQHSVHVMERCPKDPLVALLHDAAEAYLGDITRPLKALLGPHLAAAEERVHRAIARRFGIGEHIPQSVHEADERMLFTERRDLLTRPPAAWGFEREPYPERIEPWPAERAFTEFCRALERLTGEMVVL